MTCARMCRFPDGHSFGEFPKDGLCGAMLFVGAPRVLLVDGRAVMLEDGAPRFAFFQFSFFWSKSLVGVPPASFLTCRRVRILAGDLLELGGMHG